MPLLLPSRDTDATEFMDDPGCDRDQLFNTYRQFDKVNGWIGRWRQVYRSYLLPDARKALAGRQEPITLLDIGFGGGDIPIKLARWADHDQLPLRITAIDTDPRACEYIERQSTPESVTFLHASSTDLVERNRRFDYVISNHLLHHLHNEEFQTITAQARTLSRRRVLFNDIERSDLGYLLFQLLAPPLFRNSFITHDGLTSIRRSFTLRELREIAPEGWSIQRLFPYRLLLSYTHGS